MRKLGEHFGRDPSLVKQPQLRQYLLYLVDERGFSGSAMSIAKAAFKLFYRDMLGCVKWTVFQEVVVRRPRTVPTVLHREDVARLLQAVHEQRIRVCLNLIYHCGLRVGEAVRIQRHDLDDRQLRIHVKGKGGKHRYVPVSLGMFSELLLFWRTHENPKWLFPSPGRLWHRAKDLPSVLKMANSHLSTSAVQSMFRVVRARMGVHHRATVHTLRHCYATHLLEERVSLRLISEYLGHHSLDVTAIYTHITASSEEMVRAALDVLHTAVTTPVIEGRQQLCSTLPASRESSFDCMANCALSRLSQ